jgi:hypothetical protein
MRGISMSDSTTAGRPANVPQSQKPSAAITTRYFTLQQAV